MLFRSDLAIDSVKTKKYFKNLGFQLIKDVNPGDLKNGQELGADGVKKIVTDMELITPKNIVDSIAKELDWGAEKLRDDITCLAINLNKIERVKKDKKIFRPRKSLYIWPLGLGLSCILIWFTIFHIKNLSKFNFK